MKGLIKVISNMLLAISIFVLCYLTLTHPDMTSQRLFMTYWKEIIICSVIFAFTYKIDKK